MLDATQLEVKEVIVLRGVLNEATLKVNAPGRTAEFSGPLNARAKVFIDAPGRTVTLKGDAAQLLNETNTLRRLLGRVNMHNANVFVSRGRAPL
jgi:hypothetical protein